MTCTFASGTVDRRSTPLAVFGDLELQPANGTYTIIARATDNVGNTTDSSTVTVLVSNAVSGEPRPSTWRRASHASAGTTGTTLAWSQTVGAQSNRILLVVASAEHTTPSCSTTSVTYGGVAMTEIGDTTTTTGSNGGNRDCVSLWYMLNPPTGTATVSATMAPSIDTASPGGGFVIYNAKQAAPDASATASTRPTWPPARSPPRRPTRSSSMCSRAAWRRRPCAGLPQAVLFTIDGERDRVHPGQLPERRRAGLRRR